MMTDILKSFKHSSTTKGKGRFSELRWLIVRNELMKKWITTVCVCHAEETSPHRLHPPHQLHGQFSKEKAADMLCSFSECLLKGVLGKEGKKEKGGKTGKQKTELESSSCCNLSSQTQLRP